MHEIIRCIWFFKIVLLNKIIIKFYKNILINCFSKFIKLICLKFIYLIFFFFITMLANYFHI